jgi:hypothetical protein
VRLFGAYQKALAAATITDQFIAGERTRRAGVAVHELPTAPRVRLTEAPSSQLAAVGLDPDLIRALAAEGFAELLLSQAVDLARFFGGSLDWLAERTPETGEPPAASTGTQVDAHAIRQLRTIAQISDTDLRAAIEIPLGPWRRVQTGRDIPTLGLTAAIAGALGVATQDLLLGREL